MTQCQRIVLASRPQGDAAPENFRLETAELPAPEEGEVLLRTIWLSLDPYMRGRMNAGPSYAPPVEIGEAMAGQVVAEVVESRDSRLQAGDIVLAGIGWASHGVAEARLLRKLDPELAPVSTALGVLGMPGHTAWVGLNDILRMDSGETIVIGAATGAVGSVAGQLAKRAGLKPVGIAGGAEKCAYAVEHLGYDVCLDHRDPGMAEELAAVTPQGVDCYYENVGGDVLQAVLPRMNDHGRIAVCGMVAWYSAGGGGEALTVPGIWRTILVKRLRVQGFLVFDHANRLQPFLDEVGPLVGAGEIHYRESVAEGLEAAPEAFLEMLTGGNFGKQLVRVGSDP
ncbi:NADP-dependent oxidoreductase [Psychromarinibacter sp. C21-152]|uniref:NADP-dependent oxidoreductase n=1 Tax=Psychromarinibacter sediminicola TaxID=3033385 RepID=A0AAE3NVI3_9RHOB|nr:NADP-dependent oxidoreductase [Psychromarinibacter sediminicola]MDF0601740.1 NADP-dependent oxidoreductase [Psychromarinibacter sediminicola]